MLRTMSPRVALFSLVILSLTGTIFFFGAGSMAQGESDQTLPAPRGFKLEVSPATTVISASWKEVTEADSYRLIWRHRKDRFVAANEMSVTDPVAEFSVEQGSWIVRVQACNEDGCGSFRTAKTPVIINIIGHAAVRFWFDPETSDVKLDWDKLRGHYLVKYRTVAEKDWITSKPLAETGFTITKKQIFALKEGTLDIQVFYNCNSRGKNCDLLGKFPDETFENLSSDDVKVMIPTDPHAVVDGAQAASDSKPEIDPVTGQLRTDLTVTTETIDGVLHRCVSRPAENDWEKAMFGPKPKSCSGSSEDLIYIRDPDAVFPNDAVCGWRPAADAEEREFHGDNVLVCNDTPPAEGDPTAPASKTDDAKFYSSGGVDAYVYTNWPSRYAEAGGRLDKCIRRTQTRQNYYSGTQWVTGDGFFPVSVTVDWCYRWRHRVQYFQTIRAEAWQPPERFFSGIWYKFPWKFCGWVTGMSPDDPHEIVWQYGYPKTNWGYSSLVMAQYGVHPSAGRNKSLKYLPNCYPATKFTGGAGILVDWEGQHRSQRFYWGGKYW